MTNPYEKERSEMMSYKEYQTLTYGGSLTSACITLRLSADTGRTSRNLQAVRGKETVKGGID